MASERTHEKRTTSIALRRSALTALALMIVATLWPARATPAVAQRPDGLVLIIGSATGIADMPSDVVRTAFLGLRAEYRGIRLIPFNLPLKTAARERADRILLGLDPDEVGSFWVDQRVRDGRVAPRTAPSLEIAVRLVGQVPGAIACVPASAVEPHVRALRIDGKEPSDSGYLLARE